MPLAGHSRTPGRQMEQVWAVFISIVGVLVAAKYVVQPLIPVVYSGAGAVSAELIPLSYWYVYVIFYVIFAPLIIYYAWKTASILNAASTVARLILLALALWVIRFLGNLDAPTLINLIIFGVLFLSSFRFKRATVYAAILIGLVYTSDLLIPGAPGIRLPLPSEFASGLTSLLLLVYALVAVRTQGKPPPDVPQN